MNKEQDKIFYIRYLQNKMYFKNNKVIHALFNLEKYLFENFDFNEEVPISVIKNKWIYNCIEKNEFDNEVSKNFKVLGESKFKDKILLLVDAFNQIPHLKQTKSFFHYFKNFNKIFNSLIDIEIKTNFKTSYYFQFVFLIYIKKFKMDNSIKNKINSIYDPTDVFEIVFVDLFLKNFDYKISKTRYLFKLLTKFVLK